MTAYPRAYAWAHCRIMRAIIVQPIAFFAALDCITRDEIIVCPYDDTLLGRLELTYHVKITLIKETNVTW